MRLKGNIVRIPNMVMDYDVCKVSKWTPKSTYPLAKGSGFLRLKLL